MVKKILLSLFIFCMGQPMQAQTNLAGEYYLQGVMEVASGFLLKPDSTFSFFFSYGALDREGSGTWSVAGQEIIFQSEPRPPHDFELITQKTIKQDGILIRIKENNKLLLPHVYARVETADTVLEEMSDEKGEIRLPARNPKTISLLFEFCPEKLSVFPLQGGHNYFEYKFKPLLSRYYFDGFRLSIRGENLEGSHPLLNDKSYVFEKR